MAIVSVTATINGEVTELTKDSDTGRWVGTITIPEHVGYTDEIVFTATNDEGYTTENEQAKVYIFILLTFITDRAASDVAYVQELLTKLYAGTITDDELAEWETDLKGTLNQSDITRIYENFTLAVTNYFSQVAEYSDSDLSDILELNEDEFPLEEHFQYILDHLDALEEWAQNNDLLESTVPGVPSLPLNNYTGWNTIETIIEQIYLYTIDHHI